MIFIKQKKSILIFSACLLALLGHGALAMASELKTVTVKGGILNPFWLSPKKVTDIKSEPKPIRVSKFSVMPQAVTIEQFKLFLDKNPHWKKDQVSPLFSDATYLAALQIEGESPKAPMTSVSWFAAKAFCEYYHMRLPTIAEWEYMAAASETKADANRDPKFLQRILDWYGEVRPEHLKEVGSIYKNMYGVWDLHGLIWEWVEDFNSSFVTGESREDTSFNKDMFCGAGSMNGANKEDYAAFMRFGFRSSLKGKSSIWNLGFRCVK